MTLDPPSTHDTANKMGKTRWYINYKYVLGGSSHLVSGL